MTEGPTLRVVDANASPEEVAAIVAAVSAALASSAAAAAAAVTGSGEPPSRWVQASRLTTRRTGLSRGEWRLSGRIGRRARA